MESMLGLNLVSPVLTRLADQSLARITTAIRPLAAVVHHGQVGGAV